MARVAQSTTVIPMNTLIPGGAQTISKMRGRFPSAYPQSIVSANRGPLVADARGRVYLDWICALGAISLGYHDEAVDQAVHDQVDAGPIFSLPNIELEERVAQRLVDLIPCAESVRFVKTGSEATEAAGRVARAATGRELVVCCRGQYHGWHSWHAATREDCPGVPLAMTELVRQFVYNDVASLDKVIDDERQGDTIAAIILEPTLIEPPAPGFLEGVRDRATRIGALLIFDEMVTGFRWHAGGAQAYYGVTPDLACVGKGMGNGYPIAALVGRADLMRHAMLVSSTFGGDCIGLAAADPTLARYQQGGVCEHMLEIGDRLMVGYNALAEQIGAPTRMIGQAPHPVIRWDEVDSQDPHRQFLPEPNRHRASLFFQETVTRGILFHPEGINIMLAHSKADVDETLEACRRAMIEVMTAIRDGTVLESIIGDPIDPRPVWRATQ